MDETEKWTVEMYQDARGDEPVSAWLAKDVRRAGKQQVAKIGRAIDLLEAEGLALPTQYLHKVRGDIWELLATFQRNAYRVLFYNPAGRTLVLLHGFAKTTNAIDERDVGTAERRMADDKTKRGVK